MDMQQLIRKARQMQQELDADQKRIKETQFTGTAGNNGVSVTMMGDYHVQSIKIDSKVIDAEDPEMLEDLLKVATNICVDKIAKTTEEILSKTTGGIKLPF